MGRGGPRRPPVGPHGTRAHPAGRSRAPAAAYSRGPGLGAGPCGLLRRPLTGPPLCFPGVRPPGGAHLPAVLHLRPSCSAPHCTSGKLSPARSLARPLALQLLLFGVEFPTHFCEHIHTPIAGVLIPTHISPPKNEISPALHVSTSLLKIKSIPAFWLSESSLPYSCYSTS